MLVGRQEGHLVCKTPLMSLFQFNNAVYNRLRNRYHELEMRELNTTRNKKHCEIRIIKRSGISPWTVVHLKTVTDFWSLMRSNKM